ncbi:MAG: NifB/NifX family molybdenum-iron cluster-binding protein [Syntrophobacteria bacterium]
MKFAIPLVNGMLSTHFGHCEEFAIIETEDGHIKSKELHIPPPHEPGILPYWLSQMGVKVVIAGGMGQRALNLFSQSGIQVAVGAPSSPPETLVSEYLKGDLVTGENLCDH